MINDPKKKTAPGVSPRTARSSGLLFLKLLKNVNNGTKLTSYFHDLPGVPMFLKCEKFEDLGQRLLKNDCNMQ